MPVREALINLEYQGLIYRLPNQHIKTVNLNENYIHQIFTYFALLEIKAIKNFPGYLIKILCDSDDQINFYENLYKNISQPLRQKFLKY